MEDMNVSGSLPPSVPKGGAFFKEENFPSAPFQGSGWGAFRKWLGPIGYQKFQSMLCKEISREMQKIRQRHKKACENLKDAMKGEL